jgi:hypothetical protein
MARHRPVAWSWCADIGYHRTRRHLTLGYKSPLQFLEDWRMSQQDETWKHETCSWKTNNRGKLTHLPTPICGEPLYE